MIEETKPTAVTVSQHKPRPYWYVDMKWLFGILLVVVLGSWMLLLTAYRFTEPNTAIALTTNVLAGMFSGNNLDTTVGIDELKAKINASPTKSIQPITDFPVTITAQDVNTLSPRDLRLKLFGQIAKPLYYKGAKAYAQEITNDPAKQQKFENDVSLLGLITQSRHDLIGKIVVSAGVLALLLAGAVIYFSVGFGRLVSPAVVLFVVSVPGFTLFSILSIWTDKGKIVPAEGSQPEGIGAILNTVKPALTGSIVSTQKMYLMMLGAAGVLLLLAVIGKVAALFIHRKKTA